MRRGERFRFADCELDLEAFTLARAGQAVQVEPQVLELLAYLVRHPDRLIDRDELIREVWGGRLVSDAAISSRIKSARRAVGDDGEAQRLIRTVHGRGFRFVGEVRAAEPAPAVPAPPEGDGEAARRLTRQVLKRPAIAVLPLQDGDTGRPHLVEGLTDELIAALAAWRWFPVLSRNATQRLGPEPAAAEIRALGARYLLGGKVQDAGGDLRVAVQLADAESGDVLWARAYRRAPDEVFALQDELAREIVGAIEPELRAAEMQRIARKPPGDLTAWDLAMKAAWHVNRATAADYDEAERLVALVAEREPGWGFPPTLLAFIRFQRAMLGWSAADARSAFRDTLLAAQAALAVDSRAWMAHALTGVGELWTNLDHDRALAHLEIARELNPSAPWTHHFHGCVSGFAGDLEAATESQLRVFRLDPVYPYAGVVLADLGLWSLLAGRLEEARQHLDRALARAPGYGRGLQRLVALAGLTDDRALAEDARRRLRASGQPSDRDYIRNSYPFRDTRHGARFREGLRRAGLNL